MSRQKYVFFGFVILNSTKNSKVPAKIVWARLEISSLPRASLHL